MQSRSRTYRTASLLLLGALPIIAFGCGGDDPTSPGDGNDPGPTPTFSVTVVVSGDGAGTVTSAPGGISCTKDGGTCSATYDQGTAVTLTAAAGADSELAGWGGACSGTGGCALTVTAETAVSAEFDDPTVETMTLGAAGGTISSPDGAVGLTIPGGALSADTEITVRGTELADLDAAFSVMAGTALNVWELGPSGTSFAQPITVELRTPDTGASESELPGLALVTLADGAVEVLGGGSIRRDGDDLIVSGLLDHFTPLGLYDSPFSVSITAPATAVMGQSFPVVITANDRNKGEEDAFLSAVQWQDATGAPISIVGGSNRALDYHDLDPLSSPEYRANLQYTCNEIGPGVVTGSARFTTTHSAPFGDLSSDALRATVECVGVPTHTLTITKSGTGTGGVSSSPAGIDCGDTCEAAFEENTVVTLTASPDPGSTFCGWTSTSSESAAAVTVTMSEDATVDACFNAVPVPTEVDVDAGSVSASGGVVSGGTQTLNLTAGGEVVGTIPVTFTPPAFVGSNPARFGFGQNGGLQLDFANATFPAGFPAFAALSLRICGINNSAQGDLRVDRLDGNGVVATFENLAIVNTCVLITVLQAMRITMLANAFFDITMAIVRPASGQVEVQSGPPPELIIG